MSRYELPAVVVEHQRRGANLYELILHAPPIAERATPGQFVMVRAVRTHAPLWRRPYSILRANPDKGVFSILYSVQSAFTELLAMKRIGSTVQTLGPLGSYFQPVRAARRHILVAGGVGAPPLCFFAARLAPTLTTEQELLILAGARRSEMLVGLDEFRALGAEVRIATDDGSLGYHGYVTDLLAQALDDATETAVYACGPNRMLRVAADICLARGVPCQISLDAPMPCGVGVCLGCAIPVRTPDGGVWYKRACAEGPVFWAEELLWQ